VKAWFLLQGKMQRALEREAKTTKRVRKKRASEREREISKETRKEDDDDCFYYHSWRNNVVIAFGTLSSFLT